MENKILDPIKTEVITTLKSSHYKLDEEFESDIQGCEDMNQVLLVISKNLEITYQEAINLVISII